MKVYLLIMCLFSSVFAVGQKQNISINYKPSLTYFGKQSQSFHDYYFASRKGDKTFNNSASVLYTYKLFSTVSFTTGIEYSQQGQNINFNADSAFPSYNRKIFKIELSYFRIPFTVNYSILKIKKSELDIYAGISLGMATKRKDNYLDILIQREYIGLPPSVKRYKNADWAIPIGATYKKKLTKKVSANFGIEYLIGLTDAFSENPSSKYGVLSEFDNSRQSRLSLNIGISFSLAN